ncbi:DUF761 domain-containing protein [Melia azedarach]|uniref:DUF761 domain-containing protein n=1 Tax=Melia azedarach TaxID=155640 RepID=A0ACC1Z2X3_MELAZ|nr:DUF761 domain-containing protein [Melia azedarach]
MKNRASGFLKQIISVITAMAKAKTLALKSKTRAIKTRLIIFSLLRNKKILMGSISDKLRTLMAHQHHDKKDEEEGEGEGEGEGEEQMGDENRALVVCNAMSHESLPNPTQTELLEKAEEDDEFDDNDKYPDLTHSLFDSADLDFEDPGGSVIDLVKNSKPEGQEFRLEDEIDQVADLFIKRFHRQMRIQKQLSLKRYQEMLERSA